MELFELITKFGITKPVKLNHTSGGQEILVYPDTIVINTPAETPEDEFIELVARAKMADRDPLLAVFLFQADRTESEERYMGHFARLCFPLQKAWTYRTIRRHAPDIYDREISELVEMWDALRESDAPLMLPSKEGSMALELYAILKENPENNVRLTVRSNEATDTDWESYFHALEEYIPAEPDPELYVALAMAARPGYTAVISGEGAQKHIHVRAL